MILAPASTRHEDGYADLEAVIATRVAAAALPLFRTDATRLYDHFLLGLPAYRRQHYNCKACRAFVEGPGSLVNLDLNYGIIAPLWEPVGAPHFFGGAMEAVTNKLRASKIVGVAVLDANEWGTPEKGGWTHLHGTTPGCYASKTVTASQREAELVEDYKLLARTISTTRVEHLEQVVRILSGDCLGNAGAFRAQAAWALALKQGKKHTNRFWAAVACAPPGWAHWRNNAIGTILTNLEAGEDFENIRRQWTRVVAPTTYQRPTVLKEAHLDQAEKLVETLDLGPAFKRRFATVEEVMPHAYWKPQAVEGGLFSHLRKSVAAIELPPQRLTWAKFRKDILPRARSIWYVPQHGVDNFSAIVTGPSEPLMFHWNHPFSWYMVDGGSTPARWGLLPRSLVAVEAITDMPCHWTGECPSQQPGAFLLLRGARDTQYVKGGCWFGSIIRNDLREVKPALEAYARSYTVEGQPTTCGVTLAQDSTQQMELKVDDGAGTARYIIDRWE